jgi:hypothetical protein
MPEALLPGSLADSLGRRAGLSVEAMHQNRDQHDELISRLSAGLKGSFLPCSASRPRGAAGKPSAGPPRIPNLDLADDADAAPEEPDDDDAALQKLESGAHPAALDAAAASPPDAADVVGTALAFAFMECCSLLPPPELAARVAAVTHALEGVPTGVDWDFTKLRSFFLVMLVRHEDKTHVQTLNQIPTRAPR